MTVSSLPSDPLWPRAAQWIQPAAPSGPRTCDIGLLGVPAHKTSITATSADTTPAAIRDALLRFSTYAASRDVDVAELRALDFGDVADPDGPAGELRVATAVSALAGDCGLLVALGGDNSITYSVLSALFAHNRAGWGLITLDAHHDLRDGETNGSPVRRLVEEGLPGANIVQIGIADFSNSAAYARRASEYGITVVTRGSLRRADLAHVAAHALERAGAGGRPVFVDFDVDVCDRAAVPACPSSAPGGISADELRELAYLLASDPRVRGVDITEIDAAIDARDHRTVRLAALLVLEVAAGVHARTRGGER